MSTYCTLSAIQAINPLIPKTGASAFTSTIVDTINRHEDRAFGIINGYCARRYSLPFSPVPPTVRAIAEDLVSYYTCRSFFMNDNHNRMDYFEELYAQAREDLEKIRDGEMDLVDTAGSDVTTKADDDQSLLDSTTKDYQSVFDVDDSLSWCYDQDLLDDVADKR